MKEDELLELARRQFAEAEDGNSMAMSEFRVDMKYYNGEGVWDPQVRAMRENDIGGSRPCFTISDLPPRVHQVTNEFRQNTPSIKIRPVNDGADQDAADVFTGLVRHIEQQSDADIAYQTANFYQTIAGYGYFRVTEEEVDGTPELLIKPIDNTLSVYLDPYTTRPSGSDARYCFITEGIPKSEFERDYPDVDLVGWDNSTHEQGWITEDSIRIAEWFQIERKDKLTDSKEIKNSSGDKDHKEDITNRKTTTNNETERREVCMWRKIVGNKVLKEVELPICNIPVFRMVGEKYLHEGRPVFNGMVRNCRDSVRMVSYMFSTYVEATALQPKAPYIGAAGAFQGHEGSWDASTSSNITRLEYNPIISDGILAPMPTRQPPPMASQGIMQGLVLAQNAMKDTSGLGSASLGQKGNETSGVAIQRRQNEGDVSTFHFLDNASKALRQCGRVLVQWIPKVYNETATLRILGEDGTTSHIAIDPTQKKSVRKVSEDGKIKKIYNLGVGKYDVVSSVGPSYSSKRIEANEILSQLFQSQPSLVPILGDIFVGNLDFDGAGQMAKRLKAMLPPQIAQLEANEGQEEIPPQVQAQLQQMHGQLQEGASLVQQLHQENEQLKQQLQSKDTETQAKIYAANEHTERVKIESVKDIQIAEMNNESKEAIAGLQHQLSNIQMHMSAQQEFINSLMQLQQAQHSQGMDIAGLQEPVQDQLPMPDAQQEQFQEQTHPPMAPFNQEQPLQAPIGA